MAAEAAQGFGAQEGGVDDEFELGGVVEDGLGVDEGGAVFLGIESLPGEERLGGGHVAGIGIFLEQQFEVGDAGGGHAVFDPGAAEPEEGFGAEVVGLEAAGENGELAGLLVGREDLGLGPGEARGEGQALVGEGLFVAGAEFLGIVIGVARVHAGEVLEHEVEALPGGGVAVAFEHAPVEVAGLVVLLDLAQGPAGVVGGVNDVAVVGHVLDELDVLLGHGDIVVGFGKGLVDAGELGEGHVVERPGGGIQGEAVGLLGLVEPAEDGEGVAAHDGGLAAEVVVGVLFEPGGGVGGAARVVLEGVAAAGGAVGGLGGIGVQGVVLRVLLEDGQGLVVLAVVIEADGHPVLDIGGEDVPGPGDEPGLEALDGFGEALLHGDGEGEVELDARLLRVLGEALEELAHLDFGVLELLGVDERLGAQERNGGHVGPLVGIDLDGFFVFEPGRGGAGRRGFVRGGEHALGLGDLDAVLGLDLLRLGPAAEALGLGAAFEAAQAVELEVGGAAVGQDGGVAVDAGEAVGDEEFAEIVLADLDDAEEALLLAAALGVLPARPDGEFLAGKGFLGELLALGADRHHARFVDVEVLRLVGVAVLVGLVGLGGVHEIEADDDILVAGADVEAVAVHVAVGEDGVLEFFPLAGGPDLSRGGAKKNGEAGRSQYPISNIQYPMFK